MPSPVDVRVQQAFPAPAQAVFDAWLDPAQLGRWMFGPEVRPETVLHLQTDPRVGGRFSFLVERDGQRIDHVGEYRVIEPPHRLVFTWGVAGESDGDGSEVEVTLHADAADACTLTLVQHLPAEWADYAERTRQGWTKMLHALRRLY